MDRLVGENRGEEVAVGAVLFAVEDRTQVEFGFQGAEDGSVAKFGSEVVNCLL